MRVLRVAAKYAAERGGEFPTHVRVDMIAAGIMKTYEFFLGTVQRLVRDVYGGNMGGEFIEIMRNLILGQISQAYEQAWQDEGYDPPPDDYLRDASQAMVQSQWGHVEGYYRAIVDARVDKTPIDPLLSRAQMWAGQYDAAYKDAIQLMNIKNGGNLVWRKGNTEQGCDVCASLSGIVMSAREWEELDVHPRGFPNPKLGCNGGGPANNCDCSLDPTDQRRSPRAYASVMNIISAGSL